MGLERNGGKMEHKLGEIFESKEFSFNSEKEIIILTEEGLIRLNDGTNCGYELDRLFLEKYELIAHNFQEWISQIEWTAILEHKRDTEY